MAKRKTKQAAALPLEEVAEVAEVAEVKPPRALAVYQSFAPEVPDVPRKPSRAAVKAAKARQLRANKIEASILKARQIMQTASIKAAKELANLAGLHPAYAEQALEAVIGRKMTTEERRRIQQQAQAGNIHPLTLMLL